MFPGPLSADELSVMRQPPTSLSIPISPPLVPLSKLPRAPSYPGGQTKNDAEAAKLQRAPSLADIEVGEAKIKDHLKFISEHLARVTRSSAPGPCLSNAEFVDIYQRNQHNHGHHFVVHQHDHPVAGVHYDLRLQISKSSSISFAIMYGLPGNPNSTRLSRNATETRVHNIWVWYFPFCVAQFGILPVQCTLPADICIIRTGHDQSEDPMLFLCLPYSFSYATCSKSSDC